MKAMIPPSMAKHLELTISLNPDYAKSKFVANPVVTLETIVEFNYYFRNSIWEFEMCDHLNDKTLVSTYYYTQVLRCIEQGKPFTEDRFTKFKSRSPVFILFKGYETPYYKFIHTPWTMAKFFLLIGLSCLIFLGELHMYFQYQPISNFLSSLLFTKDDSKVFSIFFFVDLYFGYLAFVSLYSLFSVQIFGFYGFYRRQTDPITFLTFVYYMAKLTYPLCYTTLFTLLGNTDRLQRTAFYQSIGNLTVVPVLGYDLPSYLPVLFLLLLVLFFTDCFSHALKALGFRFYDFTEQECEQVEEGRRIATEYADLCYEDLVEKARTLKPTTDYEALLDSKVARFETDLSPGLSKPDLELAHERNDRVDDRLL